MPAMSNFDHFDIDGRLLQLLLAVFEEHSVTRCRCSKACATLPRPAASTRPPSTTRTPSPPMTCSIHYEAQCTLDIDEWNAAQGHRRRFAGIVPGFSGVGPFLRGSTRPATLHGLLRASLFHGLAAAEPRPATQTAA